MKKNLGLERNSDMPKRTRNGTVIRRRRSARKWARAKRSLSMPRGMRNVVYHFKRTFRMTQLSLAVGSTQFYGQEFKISDLPNYTEFSALFDEYRINAISIRMVPTCTSADANPISTHIFMPNIVSVIDYNDSGPVANLDALLQYQNRKVTKFTRGHKRYFRPKIAGDVVGTGGGTAYSVIKPPFLSFGVDAPHYGLKWGLDQLWNSTTPIGLDRYVTLYFSCRTVK